MKLGKSVLLHIVASFHRGILEGKDVSQELRSLDLVAQNVKTGESLKDDDWVLEVRTGTCEEG